MLFNPNTSLYNRPVVALTAVVLCSVVLDLKLRCVEIIGNLAVSNQICCRSYYKILGAWLIRDNDNNSSSVVDQWMDYVGRHLRQFLVRLGPALKIFIFCAVEQCSPLPTVGCGGGSTNPHTDKTSPSGSTPLAPIWPLESQSSWSC